MTHWPRSWNYPEENEDDEMRHFMTPKTHNEAIEHLVSLRSTISSLLDPKYKEALNLEAKMVGQIRNEMIDLLACFARAKDDADDHDEIITLIDRLGGFA